MRSLASGFNMVTLGALADPTRSRNGERMITKTYSPPIQSGRVSKSMVLPAFAAVQDDAVTVMLKDAGSAAGTITLTRSTDGGATFLPLMAGSQVISARSTFVPFHVYEAAAGVLYRLEVAMTAGEIQFEVYKGILVFGLSDAIVLGYGPNNPTFGFVSMTGAQMQKLYETVFTPIASADIAGDLTIYRPCAGNAVAKLTVPAAAKRMIEPKFIGRNRRIFAEYADVNSIVDPNGNSLSSIKTTGGVTLNPGSRMVADSFNNELKLPITTGFLTMLEAVTASYLLDTSAPAPNLAALGL